MGLCHPDGVRLDDGGWYMPSREQGWLWDHWLAGWAHVDAVLERERRLADDDVDFGLVANGDATDGNHHKTVQIVSPNEGAHIRAATECYREPLKRKPKWMWVVRGTEAHVGKSGGLEDGMAVALRDEGANLQRNPETGAWSNWELSLELFGVFVHVTHHGRAGQRAHTRAGYARHYAHDIWAENLLRGERAPDIAVRSHCHLYDDSGAWHPTRRITRLIGLPAFQIKTAYGYRIAAEGASDIGVVALVIRPSGEVDVSSYVVSPSRGPMWTPDKAAAWNK